MESANGNGNEETEIWKWKRESESGNGNEESDVTMGMEKRNIVTFQKRIKFKMLAFRGFAKENVTRYQRFPMILHWFYQRFT